MFSLGIAVIALNSVKSGPSTHITYGWTWGDILGTILSVVAILTLTIWGFVEMILRFDEHPRVVNNKMFIVAAYALVFKLVQMKKLHSVEGDYALNKNDDQGEENKQEKESENDSEGDSYYSDDSDSSDYEETDIQIAYKKAKANAPMALS